MSWLFSQALVEEYSAGTSLGGEPFAQLNVMPTPHKFWRNDKTMDACQLSRFGLTLRLLTDAHGEELLMSYLRAFPVRTSVLPEQGGELPESEADFGWRLDGSFAKWSQSSLTWKTRQCSLLGGLESFSETWPRWGSMLNGECWEQMQPAWITNANESGLWPTPTATDGKGSPLPASVQKRAANSSRGVRLPEEMTRRGLLPGGVSNPEFSEWLMGWPLGWSDIRPLETARFREWQQQHGGF